jgi:hypothetical protein
MAIWSDAAMLGHDQPCPTSTYPAAVPGPVASDETKWQGVDCQGIQKHYLD